MRVLAVVYCLPPLLVPAAMCYLKLLLGLRERGVQLEALAIDPRTFAAPGEGMLDPSLVRLLPEDLLVHYVRSPETHPAVRLLKHSNRVKNALYRVFEPRKREWTVAARSTLKRLDLGSFDAVLTCSQPHANHLLGLEIKRRAGIPWVAYFSDPWSRNPYSRPPTARIGAHLRALEVRVLTEADAVLFTSPEMERLAREEFPELLAGKTGVVPHGYVPEWYGPEPTEPHPKGLLRILHTGHFYGPRTPLPLIQALERLGQERDLASRLAFTFHGSFPADVQQRLGDRGLAPLFTIQGTVPYLESLALMRRHDACLLVDAPLTDEAESVFLPSKLVDYLGSGRPVLGLTPREGASTRVLSEVGGRLADVSDSDGVLALFRDLVDGTPLPSMNPERTAEYHYVEVASRLMAVLERLVAAEN